MRSASKVFLIIGFVTALLSALGLIITASVFIFMSKSADANRWIIEGIQSGTITSSFNGTVEEQAKAIQELMGVLAVVFFVIGGIMLLLSIIVIATIRSTSTAKNIAILIIGVLIGNLFIILGGAFGLADGEKA